MYHKVPLYVITNHKARTRRIASHLCDRRQRPTAVGCLHRAVGRRASTPLSAPLGGSAVTTGAGAVAGHAVVAGGKVPTVVYIGCI